MNATVALVLVMVAVLLEAGCAGSVPNGTKQQQFIIITKAPEFPFYFVTITVLLKILMRL